MLKGAVPLIPNSVLHTVQASVTGCHESRRPHLLVRSLRIYAHDECVRCSDPNVVPAIHHSQPLHFYSDSDCNMTGEDSPVGTICDSKTINPNLASNVSFFAQPARSFMRRMRTRMVMTRSLMTFRKDPSGPVAYVEVRGDKRDEVQPTDSAA